MTLYHGTNIDIRNFTVTKSEQLIEYNIQDIIEYIVNEQHIEYDKAMQIFYNSQTFDKLSDVETGLYLESSAYIYGIFQDERNFGSLIQAGFELLPTKSFSRLTHEKTFFQLHGECPNSSFKRY